MAKDLITKNIINRKEFNYSKKGVNLSFTLRIDNSSELRPFKECMEEAVKDLDEIIKSLKN